MFVVRSVLKRGWLRDRAEVVAEADARDVRGRLGWDRVGAPAVGEEAIEVARGEVFTVSLRRGSVRVGQRIGLEEVRRLRGFRRLWKR